MQGISGASSKGATQSLPVEEGALHGPGGAGGVLNASKDAKESAREQKFGDIWKNIQSQYGAKAEKPREIKKTLGKDDFLRIMITQMKNQDPTSPFKAEQMATEIAQFTSVEQLQNLNQQMGKMVTANQPLERLAMTNMIGKTITIDRERFPHSENEASALTYELGRDAKMVKLSILSESGETVMTKDIGPKKAGVQNFTWDGVKDNSLPSKSGNYIFRVEARDANDQLIPMNTRGQAKVVGVSFEGQEGVLLVGDINQPQKITMRNVVRVDSNGDAGAIPGAQSLRASLGGTAETGSPETAEPAPAGVTQAPQAKKNPVLGGNFFTFEKGVGSKPLDGGSMSPEAQRALSSYQAARSAAAPAESANSAENAGENRENFSEGGFPSGFSSGDNQSE